MKQWKTIWTGKVEGRRYAVSRLGEKKRYNIWQDSVLLHRYLPLKDAQDIMARIMTANGRCNGSLTH